MTLRKQQAHCHRVPQDKVSSALDSTRTFPFHLVGIDLIISPQKNEKKQSEARQQVEAKAFFTRGRQNDADYYGYFLP